MADVDLVPPRLEHDGEDDGGRVDLRAPDGGHVRVAVAAIGRKYLAATMGLLLAGLWATGVRSAVAWLAKP